MIDLWPIASINTEPGNDPFFGKVAFHYDFVLIGGSLISVLYAEVIILIVPFFAVIASPCVIHINDRAGRKMFSFENGIGAISNESRKNTFSIGSPILLGKMNAQILELPNKAKELQRWAHKIGRKNVRHLDCEFQNAPPLRRIY